MRISDWSSDVCSSDLRKGKPALAFIEIRGVRRYLGEFNSPESHQKHKQLVAELGSSGGGQLPPADVNDLRVVELVDRYWSFAQKHYRKPDGADGKSIG